jgi:DNA-binding transcriptional LysR family regulator
MGIALLPRLAIHPVHPGVTVKHLDDGYSRRVSAIRLGQAHAPASNALLELLLKYASAYPRLTAPARH